MRHLQDGVLLDMRSLNSMSFDAEKQQVTVGGGVLTDEFVRFLESRGMEVNVGSCPTTGLIGVSFGGGLGRLQGKYGLLHDSMVSCRLVLADSSIINVSRDSHPDLFWAIRGAGHNFGIAVEATFQVYPEAHDGIHFTWDLDFGLDQCDALFTRLNEVTEVMPPELAIIILWNRQNKSGIKNLILINLVWSGEEADADEWVQRFKSLGPVDSSGKIKTTWSELPWTTYNGQNKLLSKPEVWARKRYGMMGAVSVEKFDIPTTKAFFHSLKEMNEKWAGKGLFGAMFECFSHDRVRQLPADSTAFPWRWGTNHFFMISATLLSLEDRDAFEGYLDNWKRRFIDVSGYGRLQQYVNYGNTTSTMQDPPEALYGYEPWRLEKLRALKRKLSAAGQPRIDVYTVDGVGSTMELDRGSMGLVCTVVDVELAMNSVEEQGTCLRRIGWKIRELHDKYGPVVRISHDELSYTSSGAWRKIYTQRSPEFSKCLDGRGIAPATINGKYSMPTENQERHGRLRRAVNPAFSERALREQEGFLQEHSNNLIAHLKKRCREGPVDITLWYNLCAFDIVSDLSIGQAAGALNNGDEPYIRNMLDHAKAVRWCQLATQYGVMDLLQYLTPRYVAESRRKQIAATTAKVQKRMANAKDANKDWMSYILNHETEKLTLIELVMMAGTFIVAGSGTSAGGLSGTTYLLLKNQDKLSKLCTEIGDSFKSQDEITMLTTARCKYLNAVLEEGLRLYPPVPTTVARWVPGKGEEIDGKWVPGGAAVGCNQLSCGHSELNFKRAREFIPERWLELPPGSEFENDDKEARQPFSMGPRNCIGKTMSYAEMRMVLAKVLLNFDLELADPSEDWWFTQDTYFVWEKKPLMVGKLRQANGFTISDVFTNASVGEGAGILAISTHRETVGPTVFARPDSSTSVGDVSPPYQFRRSSSARRTSRTQMPVGCV
ncbi:FAD binding domain-containing protein [Diaporthe helianthi]|uniref:FAD binding domain-containing protein n=1 Tax=Diaporthe helianthi TaxID=158607 RepID=A0A2P5HRC5_DIAHE|nr:FAD binding domain-containing protein [Diaporthe helianthi]